MKKKLIEKQVDFRDCGACCLSSIVKYYDGYIPLEVIKEDTFTGKNGTTAFHLIESFKKYGFDASGIKLEFEDLVEGDIHLPAIAHVIISKQLTHFVVIYQINKKKKNLVIMDPAQGFKTVSFDDFKSIWTNILLLMSPIKKIIKYETPPKILDIFFSIVLSEKSLLSKIIFSSLLIAFLSVLTSFYFKIAMTNVSENQSLISLLLLISIFFILYLLNVFLNYVRDYLENYLNKNIDIKLILPFLKHLFLLPLKSAQSKTTGEITTRIGELINIKSLFSQIFITIFLDLLLALASIFILYNINNYLFFILCLILIIYLIVGLIFSPLTYKKIMDSIDSETEFNTLLIENVDGFLTNKNMHQEKTLNNKIESSLIKYLKSNFNFQKIINLQNFFKNFISEIGVFFVSSIGFYLILKNQLSLLDLITFNTLLVYLLEPIKSIIDLIPQINYFKASFKKISEFTILKEENLSISHQEFISGQIEIKKLAYSYDDYHYLFQDLSLNIGVRNKVMIIGPSGSGKSTICKLLYRLDNYQKGNILIGGVNILDYELDTIRKNITYLAQKESLFTDTIYNNIVFDKEISTRKLKEVMNICHINEILSNKPLRLNTMLTEGGNNLSGGERQRIVLARALLKESQIIILDEALSEVQSEMEIDIIKRIIKYFKDKTIIYVTHRPHNNCFDQIINLGGLHERNNI